MMIYTCKKCNKEIALSEIDFEGKTFCSCGGMELIYAGTKKDSKKSILDLIISGVRDHYK